MARKSRHHYYSSQLESRATHKGRRVGKIRWAALKKKYPEKKTVGRHTARKR